MICRYCGAKLDPNEKENDCYAKPLTQYQKLKDKVLWQIKIIRFRYGK